MRTMLFVAALAAACVSAPIQDVRRATLSAAEYPTIAEASGYRRTATHAEVDRFFARVEERSDLVQRISIGESQEGRDLFAVLIADPPVRNAHEVRASGKVLVLLVGNIHAGEVCGKEALSMLARKLAGGDDVLGNVVVAILPNYNPDGNDRMAPDNRPGQVGPETMGTRANAQGLDLNRDWVKADAPETRAFIGFLNEYDPLVIVDTHTTNGSHHRYTITYQGPKHPAGDAEVIEYVRDNMLPSVGATLRERTDFESFFYGNFAQRHTLWTTYPAEPRYGVAYRGLRNRLTILSEAYAYAPFEERVVGTLEFCRAIVEYTSSNHGHMREMCERADARAVARGLNPTAEDRVALRVKAQAFAEPVSIKGFEEYDESGARTAPGAPRDWLCAVVNDFVPTHDVALPRGYLIDARCEEAIDHLVQHGIRIERLDAPMTAEVEAYRVVDFTQAERMSEGHRRIENVQLTAATESRSFPPGTVHVSTAQPLGALLAYLLEPQSTDGLVAWNFFDGHLEKGATFPVVRLAAATAPPAETGY